MTRKISMGDNGMKFRLGLINGLVMVSVAMRLDFLTLRGAVRLTIPVTRCQNSVRILLANLFPWSVIDVSENNAPAFPRQNFRLFGVRQQCPFVLPIHLFIASLRQCAKLVFFDDDVPNSIQLNSLIGCFMLFHNWQVYQNRLRSQYLILIKLWNWLIFL